MKKEKLIATIAISYFIFGVVFAFLFALYYKWTPLSFFSPGFFVVAFTWPFQAIGFIVDFFAYGFAGKPI